MRATGGDGNYRPDIDGLRAVAVLPVVLFHADSRLFAGGFVGVDIFFVISGFLIGGILIKQVSMGTLSVASFYERRIKRIIPALTATVAFTIAAGYFSLLPQDYATLGKSIIANQSFLSNYWLSRQAGYFAASAERMPLLHTWSLAVEEQFYIAFPVLIAVLARRSLLILAMTCIFMISLGLSVTLTYYYPSESFYLLPTRAWELLGGALLAALSLPRNRFTQEFSSVIGLTLIGIAVFTLDRESSFPGLLALLPVTGAMLMIYGGQYTQVGRIVASKPLVCVGLISYSLYLWHWPMLVMAKHIAISASLSSSQLVFYLAAAFTVAGVSWRFIEQPFRRMHAERLSLFASTCVVVVSVGAYGFLLIREAGIPSRFTDKALRYADARISPRGHACLDQSSRTLELCEIGQSAPVFLLWGDSHAGALLPALEYVADSRGASGLVAAFSGCPPLPGSTFRTGKSSDDCSARNATVLQRLLADSRIKVVIMTAFWARQRISQDSLRMTLDALKSKTVFIVSDLPDPGYDVPWTLALAEKAGTKVPPILMPSKITVLENVIKLYSNVTMLRLSEVLCAEDGCYAHKDGKALYADTNHMSEYAAREIVGPFLERALPNL